MSLTAKLVLSPLLVAQALRTRAKLPRLPEAAGPRHGDVGEGPGLSVLITGDSSAAGVGVVHQREALASRLAHELAKRAQRRVHWRLVAQSGLTTAQTLALLRREQPAGPGGHYDVAVVVTGVNDVVDQVPSHHAVAVRESIANTLRNSLGVAHVVFAPLPPVHLFPGLPQPLRWVAGSDAKRHDRALDDWTRTRNDVSRAEIELPLNRGLMADDGFHPGPTVYRITAHAIAEHVLQRVLGAQLAAPNGAPR